MRSQGESFDGRLLEFFNLGLSGGYGASDADTGEPYEGHECWVEGVACRADEHRFGGIVIEPIVAPNPARRKSQPEGNVRRASDGAAVADSQRTAMTTVGRMHPK